MSLPMPPDGRDSNGILLDLSSGFALDSSADGRSLACGSSVSGSCLAIAVRRASSCWSKTNVADIRSALSWRLPLEVSVPSSVSVGIVSIGKVASGVAVGRNWLSGSVLMG